jgi:hypothetical protein
MLEDSPALLPFALVGASWIGWRVSRMLAEHHRSRDTVDSMRLVLGMLVTFAAIVLGLLTSSAKGHFDTHGSNLQSYSTDLISLDQRLREYGPGADPIRAILRSYTAAAIADTWPEIARPAGTYPSNIQSFDPGSLEGISLGEMLLQMDRMIARLDQTGPLKQELVPMLAQRMQQTLQDRWNLVASGQPTISWPFLSVMVLWLLLIFAIFGLSSPANAVMYAAIALAAISLSVALWLILDFDSPLSGLLKVTAVPMLDALRHMDQAMPGTLLPH